MDIISCNACGVVLDKDKIDFPDVDLLDPDVDWGDKVAWEGSGYIAQVKCPVCKSDVREDTK